MLLYALKKLKWWIYKVIDSFYRINKYDTLGCFDQIVFLSYF